MENTDQVKNIPKLFTAREAAEILGISEVTLWRWRRKGSISYRRINGTVRFHAADIEEVLEDSKHSAVQSSLA